jgi:hypothetical protein
MAGSAAEVLHEVNVYFRKPQLEVLYELLPVKYRSNSEEMYRESSIGSVFRRYSILIDVRT